MEVITIDGFEYAVVNDKEHDEMVRGGTWSEWIEDVERKLGLLVIRFRTKLILQGKI